SVPGNPDELYRTLPLVFEPNEGQADARFDFLARGAGYSLLLSAAETVFVLGQAKSVRRTRQVNDNQSGRLCMKLLGAHRSSRALGEESFAGRVNYLIGNDSRSHHVGIPTYGQI